MRENSSLILLGGSNNNSRHSFTISFSMMTFWAPFRRELETIIDIVSIRHSNSEPKTDSWDQGQQSQTSAPCKVNCLGKRKYSIQPNISTVSSSESEGLILPAKQNPQISPS